jgi:tellurite resistance protein TehA-like permease
MKLSSHPVRPRWYLPTIAGIVCAIAALMVIALVLENGLNDTALGVVTGILFGVLFWIILFTETGRRAAIRRRDATVLDDLEPLRDAGR